MRTLALAGLVAAGCLAAPLLPLAPATALDCDRYGDRPCVVFCEVFLEWWERLQPLFPEPVAQPAC